MSDQDNMQETAPVPVNYSAAESQFFLQVLDFYRPAIKSLLATIPPAELVVVLAFLQAAMETQAPVFTEGFEDVRNFFQQVYPSILKHDEEQRRAAAEAEGQELPKENDSLNIVIPAPANNLQGKEPQAEEPRIIMPGSRLLQ